MKLPFINEDIFESYKRACLEDLLFFWIKVNNMPLV